MAGGSSYQSRSSTIVSDCVVEAFRIVASFTPSTHRSIVTVSVPAAVTAYVTVACAGLTQDVPGSLYVFVNVSMLVPAVACAPAGAQEGGDPTVAPVPDGGAGLIDGDPAALPAGRAISVHVFGDSLANGVWRGLRQAFAGDKAVRLENNAKVSSGLVRSDFYDWNEELAAILDSAEIDIAIVMLGSNDRQRLRVAGRRHLSEAVVVTGINSQGRALDALQLRQLAQVVPAVSGIRRTGSASTDLAWLAAGRFDGYWEAGLKPWDVAPGQLLLREAGGTMTDFSGRPTSVASGEVVAGNETVQAQLLKVIKPIT